MKPIVVSHFHRASAPSKKKSVKKSENAEKGIKRSPLYITVRFKGENKGVSCISGLYLSTEELNAAQKSYPLAEGAVNAKKIQLARERVRAIVDILDPFSMEICGYILDRAKDGKEDILIDETHPFNAHEIASKFVEEYNSTHPGATVYSVKERDENGNYSMVPSALTKYGNEVQANHLSVEKMQMIAAQAQEIVGTNGQKMTIMNRDDFSPEGRPTQMVFIQNTINVNTIGGQNALPNSRYNPDSDMLKWMMDSMKKSNEEATVSSYRSAQTKLIQFLVLTERLELKELEPETTEPFIQLIHTRSKKKMAKVPKYKPPHVSFKALNQDIILEFDQWMQTDGKVKGRGTKKETVQGMSAGTIKTYLSYFKSAYQLAVKEGIIENRENPFDGYVMLEPGERDLCLTEDQLKPLLEYEPKEPKIYQSGKKTKERKRHFSEREARGYWLFSLLSYGMNVKDIALLKEKKLQEDYFGFKRSKTQKKVRTTDDIEVPLHKYHTEFIERFANKKRGPEDYVFPIMINEIPPKPLTEMKLPERNQWEKEVKRRNNRRVNTFVTQVNRYMRKIALELKKLHPALGFDPKIFTTYSARHTFANQARKIMDNYEIAKLLGHKSGSVPNARVAEKFYFNSKEKKRGKEVNETFAQLMPKKSNNEGKEAAA